MIRINCLKQKQNQWGPILSAKANYCIKEKTKRSKKNKNENSYQPPTLCYEIEIALPPTIINELLSFFLPNNKKKLYFVSSRQNALKIITNKKKRRIAQNTTSV